MYGCTCAFSKKMWPGLPMYGLQPLCEFHKIELNHHRAGPDSKATAELAIKIFSQAGITSVGDVEEKIQVNLGKCFEGGYYPCGNVRTKTQRTKRHSGASAKGIIGDPSKLNPESMFFEKIVAFTGALSSMSRAEAFQVVADAGGMPIDGFNQKTDILIVGQQDFRVVGQDGMSSKQRRAIESVEKGGSVEILSEEDFLKNI